MLLPRLACQLICSHRSSYLGKRWRRWLPRDTDELPNEIAGIPIPSYIDPPETEEPAVVAAIEAEIAADALGPIGFTQEELANIKEELSQHVEPDLPKGATEILGADIPEDPLEPVGFTQGDLENIAQYLSSPWSLTHHWRRASQSVYK